MRLSNAGVTLIELMISMVIFSAAIGITSSFVKKGMEHPFTKFGVEDWIFLIEESSELLMSLPTDSDFEAININEYKFKKISKPGDFKSWQLIWKETNLPQVKAAFFIATSTSNQIYKWKIYKSHDE